MALTATAFFSRPAEKLSAKAEASFFRALRIGNSTFKMTGAGRFAALDKALVRGIAGEKRPIGEVLDVGISSGITTLELHEALRQAGHAPRTTGTDLTIDAFIVPVLPGCRALVDRQGHPLQYELFGRAVRPWRRRVDLVDGMAVLRGIANRVCGPRARRALGEGGGEVRRVELVNARLAAQDGVSVLQDDIFERNPAFVGRFDLVRVANILNHCYFDRPALERGLANARSYLSGPGAWLLVARTHGRSDHRATLFRMGDDGGLAVAGRFGGGSEVEPLVGAAGTQPV